MMPFKILVVDDDSVWFKQLETYASDVLCPFEFIHVTNSKQANLHLRDQRLLYDLILFDEHLPESSESGLTLYSKYREMYDCFLITQELIKPLILDLINAKHIIKKDHPRLIVQRISDHFVDIGHPLDMFPKMPELSTIRRRNAMDTRKVFLVYGHARLINDATRDFIRSLSLEPIEWEQMVSMTGKGAPSIMEVLETGFNSAQAVVVIFTPDEETRLRKELGGGQRGNQPRPNVILEAGMALGLRPDRTILVNFGENRPMSDLGGLHMVQMDNSPEKRQILRDRLKRAGCPIPDGLTDYLSKGDFSKIYP